MASSWALTLLGRLWSNPSGQTLADIIAANQKATAHDLTSVVAAAMAITVVNGVTGRLNERFRRLRHSPPDVLREHAIDLHEKL